MNTSFEISRFRRLKQDLLNNRSVILVDLDSALKRKLSKALEQFLDDTTRTMVLIRVRGFMWSLVIASVVQRVFTSKYYNSFGIDNDTTMLEALSWLRNGIQYKNNEIQFENNVIDGSLASPIRSIRTLIPYIFSKITQQTMTRQPDDIAPNGSIVMHEFIINNSGDPNTRTKEDFLNEWMRYGLLTPDEVTTCSNVNPNAANVMFGPFVVAIALIDRVSVEPGGVRILYLKSKPDYRKRILSTIRHEFVALRNVFSDDYPLFSMQSNSWTEQNTCNLFLKNYGVPHTVRTNVLETLKNVVIRTHVLTSSDTDKQPHAVAVYYSAPSGEEGRTQTHILYAAASRGFKGVRQSIVQQLLALVLRERPLNIYHGRISSIILASGIKLLSLRENSVYGWDLTDPEQFAWLDAKISENIRKAFH